MEEGKESAQIQVDGVFRMLPDRDESCGARCLALTPCQGLAVAGFTRSVFAALKVAEGSLALCLPDCHLSSLCLF